MSDLHEELVPRVVGTGLSYAIIPLRSTRTLARGVVRHRPCCPSSSAPTPRSTPSRSRARTSRGWRRAVSSALVGIPEDPATGSAAGPLAAYLARAGLLAAGAARVVAQGDHAGRPSRLTVSVTEEHGRIVDVQVAGGVVPVLSGVLEL